VKVELGPLLKNLRTLYHGGETQEDAAARLNVNLATYRAWCSPSKRRLVDLNGVYALKQPGFDRDTHSRLCCHIAQAYEIPCESIRVSLGVLPHRFLNRGCAEFPVASRLTQWINLAPRFLQGRSLIPDAMEADWDSFLDTIRRAGIFWEVGEGQYSVADSVDVLAELLASDTTETDDIPF